MYFEFGNSQLVGHPYRDDGDVILTQLMIDYYTSFVRAHDPNPDPSYLLARGYKTTYDIMQNTGEWKPVTASSHTLRRLDVRPWQSDFIDVEQCDLLGLPLDYYESQLAPGSPDLLWDNAQTYLGATD